MTVMEFWGCTCIAFGPVLAMFIITVAKDPIRIILLIASAFFWLVSLLISSLLWFAVWPLRKHLWFGMFFSVLFQELFRLVYYFILRKAESGMKKITDADTHSENNRHTLAYVSGLGFGIISGAFSLVNVLADSSGPGSIGLKGDSQFFFLVSAFTTLAFILMHTFWGIIIFEALDRRKYWKAAICILSHLAVSLLTLFNQLQWYWATLIPIYIITIALAVWAFHSAGGSFKSFLYCLICKGGRIRNQAQTN